jgi:hypothetical protein
MVERRTVDAEAVGSTPIRHPGINKKKPGWAFYFNAFTLVSLSKYKFKFI